MDGDTIVQVDLLLQMRSEKVSSALQSLGVAQYERSALMHAVESVGLRQFPGDSSLYRRLLSASKRRESNVPVGVANRPRAECYQLSLWPDVDFLVIETSDGVLCGVEFAPRNEAGVALAALQPWCATEAEFLAASGDATVCEEWYPVRDYVIESVTGPTYYQFDFGLLQRIVAEKLPRDAQP